MFWCFTSGNRSRSIKTCFYYENMYIFSSIETILLENKYLIQFVEIQVATTELSTKTTRIFLKRKQLLFVQN